MGSCGGTSNPALLLKSSLKINILFSFLFVGFLICLSITIKDKYVFDETSENIQAVEDYLDEHKEILQNIRGQSNRGDSPRLKGGEYLNTISANDIAEWIYPI